MMDELKALLFSKGLLELLPTLSCKIAFQISDIVKLKIYFSSLVVKDEMIFFMGKNEEDNKKYLGIIVTADKNFLLNDFTECFRSGQITSLNACWKIYSLNNINATNLRKYLSFLSPCLIGKGKSIGCGDRLGISTPGHIMAVNNTDFFPILAQQSIREMKRTGRTAVEVMDDAMWGVFQQGFRKGFGSDGDHLKTIDDIDYCLKAGFTLYTLDSGDYLDNEVDEIEFLEIEKKYFNLPWQSLKIKPLELEKKYVNKTFSLPNGYSLSFNKEDFLKISVRYGKALVHILSVYNHLCSKKLLSEFEFEISVDEVDFSTTILEHFFIANELQRLGVKWLSLALRFIGKFEKGVDYIGDIKSFEKSLKEHLSVVKYFGSYKLSFHSSSDKFSIYPCIGREVEDSVHFKTAGTTYLEALRTISILEPNLFNEILLFAIKNYENDRKSYHVSADLNKVNSVSKIKNNELVKLLDNFDVRQVLHVTFGSVLTASNENGNFYLKNEMLKVLKNNEEKYYEILSFHIRRHIEAFKK
ncbi:MAG: tagaturonate epimerase family protein [bacterium]